MNIDKIKNLDLPPVEQAYNARDTILYALGLGYGADPLDESELPFVYEANLKAVPSISCVLCHPGFWLQKPEYEADWVKILHAEQAFEIHQPLPPTGTLRGTYSVSAIEDKGIEKGALLQQDKKLYDVESGDLLATVRSTLFLRGDGGQGEFGEKAAPAQRLPEGAPDRTLEFATDVRSALIYRLSGDWNPLHADPEVARNAGFERPILHGLCTAGVACRAIMQAYCDNDTDRLQSMFVRFSSPVFPGETIRIEFYESGNTVRFRAVAVQRGVTVLDRCSAEFSPG
jgi:acyl dehydratase